MNKSFAEIDLENDGNYLKLLSAVSKLSGLFSESSIPFINYRVAENIFCRSFGADNLSRSDTAFDANYNSVGVGLKTFTCQSGNSTEKVAEFNSLSRVLKDFAGKDLAHKLAEFRNERINLANRVYNIENSLYHIVARKEKELFLYETDYEHIDIKNIHSVKQNSASLQFEDGKNFYSFNFSKSTLFRKFSIPDFAFRLPIEILEDPYTLLLELFQEKVLKEKTEEKEFVILPLYGYRKNKEKFVFERSGLNQWNANGRKRDFGEIYIPIPIEIHKSFPNFFPPRDKKFNLEVPTKEILSAKVCQENSKALMTDPNKALSDWLLRKVLKLKEGELATVEKLNELGFDSVIITKIDEENFKIDIMKTDSYEIFNVKNM
ncbi:MAG TPA: restriction endonuclease [Chryseobacterium sp.]|nr:restriction endonuclease [Chryseobacterium sp.]